jgi:hypothetical protein
MADLPNGSSADTGTGSGRRSAPGTPLWVKVFGIIALALVLLFVVLHLTGHAPRGHTTAGEHGAHEP